MREQSVPVSGSNTHGTRNQGLLRKDKTLQAFYSVAKNNLNGSGSSERGGKL